MAENHPTENEQFAINPDGADLDGTAEIERHKVEDDKKKPTIKPPDPADKRWRPETVH